MVGKCQITWVAWVALLLLLGGSCSGRTEVFLILNANRCIETQITVFDLRVTGPDGIVHESETSVSPTRTFPFHIPVIPVNGDATRTFVIDVVARDEAGDVVATLHHESGFVEGELIEQALVLGAPTSGGGERGRTPIEVRVPSYSSTEQTWVDVPEASLEFDASTSDGWAIFVSAQVRGDLSPSIARLRLIATSDEEEVQIAYVEGASQHNWTTWTHADWAVGGGARRYRVQASAARSGIALRDLRLIAVPISGASGLVARSGNPETVLRDNWQELSRVCAEPGEYLMLASVSGTERDTTDPMSTSGTGVFFRVLFGETEWPAAQPFESNRTAVRSFLWARRITIDSSASLVLQGKAGRAEARASAFHPRVVLLRIGDAHSVDSVEDTGFAPVDTQTRVSELVSAPPPGTSHQLVLQGATLSLPSQNDGESRQESRLLVGLDDTPPREARVYQTIQGNFTAAAFSLVESGSPLHLSNDIAPDDDPAAPLIPVNPSDSFIHVFHL